MRTNELRLLVKILPPKRESDTAADRLYQQCINEMDKRIIGK